MAMHNYLPQCPKLSPYFMQSSRSQPQCLRGLERILTDNFRQVFHSIYESIHWPKASVKDNAGQQLSG